MATHEVTIPFSKEIYSKLDVIRFPMLGIKSCASYLLITISSFTCLFFLSDSEHMSLAYASSSLTASTTMINTTNSIPNAESVHLSESMKVPSSVGTFVILIANEAHENWSDEKHKLITDKNSYYVPTNLVIPNGTAIVFLNADALWDTPHPHTIETDIIQTAIKENVGIIIMGTTGLTGVSKIKAFGSVARNVTERAKCPVMLVR